MRHNTVRYATIVIDIILINLAFALAYVARYEWQWLLPVIYQEPYQGYLGQQLLLTVILILTFRQHKVWRRRRGEAWVDEMSRILSATASGIAIMMAISFFYQPAPFSRLLLVWALLFIVVLLGLARLIRHWTLRVLYRRGYLVDDVVVVGSGEVGRSVIRTLLARPDLGYRIIGYLDDGMGENNIGSARVPHLGSYKDLALVLEENPSMHTVFVTLPGEMNGEILTILRIARANNTQAQVVPDVLQMSLNQVEFINMSGIPMLGTREVRISRLGRLGKRFLDLGIALLVSFPILLASIVIALAIKLDSEGPVFYRGLRIGKEGKQFQMYKFRSMIIGAEKQKLSLQGQNEADGPIFKIKDDPRLTKVGRWLRRTSLDELPQIYNVILGQMSLVGPRPPLPEEVEQYKSWQKQRLTVIGGITGLWQVSGRSDLTFDELCLLDIYYIENWSLTFDIRILLQTIPYVLFGRGAY
ncbi:MAG: sugar transferase [Candidatus Promineifilaceae bacterium]|jgi:exopolysaccharide biosynthesis polyprenyl glycosylphosphotransferase